VTGASDSSRPSDSTPPDLEECLADAGLDGDRAAAFERTRRRIRKHHDQWRREFPTYGSLLDDDVQRAQALAGSHAAEGRDTLEAWVEARLDQGGGEVEPGRVPEMRAWLRRYAEAWKATVRERVDLSPWDREARHRFHEVLDDVVEAGRTRAAARLEEASAARPPGWRNILGPLGRPLAALGRTLRAIFLPGDG